MEDKELIARIRHGDGRLSAAVVRDHSAAIFSKVLSND